MRLRTRNVRLLLALGMLLGLLAVAGVGSHAAVAPTSPGAPLAAHPAVRALAGPHGDLVVGSGQTVVLSPATTGSPTYAQAGNITVQTGGTLVVRNETIDFVQFVGSSGSIANRLSHIYTVVDQGSITLWNSSITTDTSILNAYSKLTLTVSTAGSLSLQQSSLRFPGWVTVTGSGSTLVLNQSTIGPNPGIRNLVENLSLLGDTVWAPDVQVLAGAHASLYNSSVLGYYKDNATAFGPPGPAPATNNSILRITSSNGGTYSAFSFPTDSENVTRADLYPQFAGGTIQFEYEAQNPTSSTGNTFTFGSAYALPTIVFGQSLGVLDVPIPAAAMAQINSVGPVGWMQATGAFGGGSSLALHFGTTGVATPVNITLVSISLTPVLAYNVTVDGVGSVLTAADSTLDLNWNLTPGTPVGPGTPTPLPWSSNKLYVTNGAQAFLASLSVTHGRNGVFWNASAVIPDASSTANFYRWSLTPVTAAGGSPVVGAQVAAFYAYDTNQLNNATATALNTLGTADADLAAYVASWDALHHLSGYGVSDSNGDALLLLASSQLTQGTLPDGLFLGGYHYAVTLAGGGAGSTQWGYGAVTPYPAGMTPAMPDSTAPFVYPGYHPSLGVGSVTVYVNGAPVSSTPTIRIGDPLNITAVVTDTGTGPVTNFTVAFGYVLPSPFPAKPVAPDQSFGSLAVGASRTVNFSWVINESITGLHGTYGAQFALTATWNGGVGPSAGNTTTTFDVTIAPAAITITFVPPSGNLKVGTEYLGTGTLAYAGLGAAIINVTATGPGGTFLIAQTSTTPGTFTVDIVPLGAMTSGTYTVTANATYNSGYGTVTIADAFTIGSGNAATTPWYDLTIPFLGIMLWLLLVIIAIAVAAIVGFLLVSRRAARGKLVECGECGNLIPENATACPKCGAEFETDLVRCSRCGSTIPANSKVCPECAAPLLGDVEAQGRDPERQGYNDFIERYRAESKKDLGENYSEGAFWDWWKRQPSYISFSQWRLQQAQGSRAGMGAPPAAAEAPPPTPPRRGPGAGGAAPAPAAARPPPPSRRPPPAAAPPAAAAPAAPAADEGGSGGAPMKACSNCGKEIPPDYLVCPFCGAVTQ